MGITRAEAATRLGVHPDRISSWEKGREPVTDAASAAIEKWWKQFIDRVVDGVRGLLAGQGSKGQALSVYRTPEALAAVGGSETLLEHSALAEAVAIVLAAHNAHLRLQWKEDSTRLDEASRAYRAAQDAAEAASAALRQAVIDEWLAGADATAIAKATGIHRKTVARWVDAARAEGGLSEADVKRLRQVKDSPAAWARLTRELTKRPTVTIADCARASDLTPVAARARLHTNK